MKRNEVIDFHFKEKQTHNEKLSKLQIWWKEYIVELAE